ncbi:MULTISPECIES: acetyl/propionyl/methylcrotonyl-CoA carboxylase subunit alpha [unclassified Comamonas]|uniref:acetyl-CoA carboxylase biotin carboxylase subunit n=1 Tax=unclassified Comamonas TaxID=2638500 RepID=UPI001FA7B479|nr:MULTISPECIES: biotin carboxylase N-terminal domain-containing protein [unclassified Comamonas]UNV88545.1 biotin carboxylase [Comamonas sp. 7D-2evo1]UNV93552.1 biotin carboxylase [Comamonas sp. 7D-2]UNV98188.1 biotin carboxylase [Comamonas sp. 7D-2evo2]
MFLKVLVANRGAVAARVLRALRAMGIPSVAVYSEADRELPYVAQADESYCIGPAPAQHSYLNQERLLQVLEECGADAVHPGYGFLSESAEFAQKVIAAGACFIGPDPKWIEAMGHKTNARDLMASNGLKMGNSSALLSDDPVAIVQAAEQLGYPVLIKPASGGGGIGMTPVHAEQDLLAAVEKARNLAGKSFGSSDVYLERLYEKPRHIEFQILADRHGRARHLFERDCSVQRRHQKVLEEAPAPGMAREDVNAYADSLANLFSRTGYDVIGTVETLNDGDSDFNFLEVNTRLQVEHAVTEEVTGIDIVQAQIRLAAGAGIDEVLPPTIELQGHAIEARIYAEDPVRFLPSPGLLKKLVFPAEEIRVETGYAEGCTVTPYYDPMLAKLIAWAPTRAQAIAKLQTALQNTVVEGIKTNIPFIQKVLGDPAFANAQISTQLTQQILSQ